MNKRVASIVVLILTATVAVVALQRWFVQGPAVPVAVSLPGADGRPAGLPEDAPVINLAGTFQSFDGVPSNLPGSWPRFRGPDFDNIKKSAPQFADSWDATPPEILWGVDLGEGHAAPVVLNGRVYLIDYDEETRCDAIRCWSLDDGREIWRRSYPVAMKRNHGLSRTVPAVTDEFLLTLGPRAHVVCLKSKTGDFLWGIDLQREYGTEEPLWYTGQCPMIDQGLAITAPGGPDVLMMAVDCASGDIVWTTPNPNEWEMSHSSIMPMMLGDTKTYVYAAVGGMTGVLAEGPDAGKILWEAPWNARVVAPSPVILDDNVIYITAGYGAGSMRVQINTSDEGYTATMLAEDSPKDWLACEQQTPIFYEGLLYGIMPKDAGALRNQFVCYDPKDGLVWSSGQAARFGIGPFLLADNKFFILDDDGTLTMIRVSRDKYVPLGQVRIIEGQDAWGPLALVGDRLLLRDSKRMVCAKLPKAG